jgi:hypothetical protein
VLARAAELETLSILLRARTPVNPPSAAEALERAIQAHVDAAKAAATDSSKPLAAFSGAPVVRATRNLHAAEIDLLRLAPTEYLRGQLAAVQAYVHRVLPRGEGSRSSLDAIVKQSKLSDPDREAVLATLREAQSEDRKSVARVRSFRNVLLVTAAGLALGALAMALLGVFAPDAIPLCFHPGTNVVCPTAESPVGKADVDTVIADTTSGWDLALVEIVGVLAAGIAAAAALRRIKGTSTPYSLPVALAVLKLPTGALTALLGLLLMRGQFVPGLSALDNSGQIVAWAVVFGYSQQLFTRLVDDQAQTVLDKVGSPGVPAAGGQDAATAADAR